MAYDNEEEEDNYEKVIIYLYFVLKFIYFQIALNEENPL